MQRLGREVYLAILLVMLLLFGAMGLRSAQRNRQSGGSKPDAAFAAVRYPYSQLSPREQRLYDTLYEGISAHELLIRLPDAYTAQEYERVYLMVMMQEPELFYVDRIYEVAAEVREVKIYYTMTEAEADAMQKKLEAAADSVIAQITPMQNEWQKLLVIHDAIGARCTYGKGPHSDDAIGPLVEGTAMCEGYAKAFLYTVRRAGLEMMCVPGRIGNGTDHVWNVAKIEGAYYNMDLTFDDDDSYGGETAHPCFAADDAVFYDHLPDRTSYEPPACNDSARSYYYMKGYVLNDPTQITQRVRAWMGGQTGGITEFYCGGAGVDMHEVLKTRFAGTGYRIYWDEVRQVAVVCA